MIDVYDAYAWLYDAAFSWDIRPEVKWILQRLKGDAILEPACGSGRMLLGLTQAGATVAGFDREPTMLERARKRFRDENLPEPPLLVAELAACRELEWGQTFDGAVLPIGTFAYLQTKEHAAAHLAGIARHLRPGGSYLIQIELRTLNGFRLREPGPTNCWDTPHPRGTVRCTVFGQGWDPETCIETEISRYEIIDGPEAGFVHECEHHMRVWSWESWSALIESSPFRQSAAWDGNHRERPALELGPGLEERLLVWHQLEG